VSPESIPGLAARDTPRPETPRWGYQDGASGLIVHATTRERAAFKLVDHLGRAVTRACVILLCPSIEERPACDGALAGG
jgi:hypothetical protein